MLSLSPAVRIWVCLRPTDMRKSFDGLAAMTRQVLLQDPIASGHLFVFVSRRADRLKALWWDRDGYALYAKRLERGTFRLPAGEGEGEAVALSPAELAMLLEGIEPAGARRRKRLMAINIQKMH
jgi:transposase